MAVKSLVAGLVLAVLFVGCSARDGHTGCFDPDTASRWLLTAIMHVPHFVILLLVTGGLIEPLGCYGRGRAPGLALQRCITRSGGHDVRDQWPAAVRGGRPGGSWNTGASTFQWLTP